MCDAGVDAEHQIHTFAQCRRIAEIAQLTVKPTDAGVLGQSLPISLGDIGLQAEVLKIVAKIRNQHRQRKMPLAIRACRLIATPGQTDPRLCFRAEPLFPGRHFRRVAV